jgi:hypothetical protein
MRELIRRVLRESIEGYDKIIQEGKQVGTLYHYTSLGAAHSILEDGFIEGGDKSISGYLESMVGDNKYSLSLTRNKNFHKFNRWIGDVVECRFVIDGDSLSNIYKIQPITAVSGGIWDYKKQSKDFEAEEVILSPNPIEVPIIPYVIRFDFLIKQNDKKYFIGYDPYEFINMLKKLKKQGISINIVDKNGNPVPKELKLTFKQWLMKPLYKLTRFIDNSNDDWNREPSDNDELKDLDDLPI